jgi:hypothetical protein
MCVCAYALQSYITTHFELKIESIMSSYIQAI